MRSLPVDGAASSYVREWLEGKTDVLQVTGADLRGADFSNSALGSSWFTSCNLQGVSLIGADLYRANMVGADLTGAVLTGASLVRTDLSQAVLVDALVDSAEMVRTELYGVDARSASFEGSHLLAAEVVGSDFRGASLEDTRLERVSLKIVVDDSTVFRGMVGSMRSRLTYVADGKERELVGSELREFLKLRGAEIEIIEPGRPEGQE